MKLTIRLTLTILVLCTPASHGAIRIVNDSDAAFKPELKFVSKSGSRFQCNQGLPFLNPHDTATVPNECFVWGEETAYLHQFIGVQTTEQDQLAFCPEFEPKLKSTDNVTIHFRGVDATKPQPANGICTFK